MLPEEAVLHERTFFSRVLVNTRKVFGVSSKNSAIKEIMKFLIIFCIFAVFENFVFPLEVWFP